MKPQQCVILCVVHLKKVSFYCFHSGSPRIDTPNPLRPIGCEVPSTISHCQLDGLPQYWLYQENEKSITVLQGNILVDSWNHCFMVLSLLGSKYFRINCNVRTSFPLTLHFELKMHLDNCSAVSSLWCHSLSISFGWECTMWHTWRSVGLDWWSYLLWMSKNRMSDHQYTLKCWYSLEMTELQLCCICSSPIWCEVWS